MRRSFERDSYEEALNHPLPYELVGGELLMHIRAYEQEDILDDVFTERDRQLAKWGPQTHPNGTGAWDWTLRAETIKRLNDDRAQRGIPDWSSILLEEIYEAFAERDEDKLREELVQCAAVIFAWIEDMDNKAAQEAA